MGYAGTMQQKALERHQQAIDLRLKGLTYREIGKHLGVSTARAQQLCLPKPLVYSQVRHRANFRCERCTIELTSGHMHHKHIHPTHCSYNDLQNLEYLCHACHRRAHI